MANEIRITEDVQILHPSNGFRYTSQQRSWVDDMAGAGGGGPGIVDVTDVEQAISFGDTAPGWVWLTNLDAANDVYWGPDDNFGTGGGSMARLGLLKAASPPHRIYLAPNTVLKVKTVQAGTTAKILVQGFDA